MRRYLGGEWLPSPPLFCFSACWYLGSSWGRVRITQQLCGSRRLLTWWFFPKLWRKQWKEGRKEEVSFAFFLPFCLYFYMFILAFSIFSLHLSLWTSFLLSLFLLHLFLFILLSVDGRGWIHCFVLGFFPKKSSSSSCSPRLAFTSLKFLLFFFFIYWWKLLNE